MVSTFIIEKEVKTYKIKIYQDEDPQHIIEEMEKEIINNYDYQLQLGI